MAKYRNTFDPKFIARVACEEGRNTWKRYFGSKTMTLAEVFGRWARLRNREDMCGNMETVFWWTGRSTAIRKCIEPLFRDATTSRYWGHEPDGGKVSVSRHTLAGVLRQKPENSFVERLHLLLLVAPSARQTIFTTLYTFTPPKKS